MYDLAKIEGNEIVIRISKDALKTALKVYNDHDITEQYCSSYEIEDIDEFAKEILYVLNSENNEVGDTLIIHMMDVALQEAINQGAFGLREIPSTYEPEL